jgi:ribosome maturation protein SDO1
MVSLDKAIIARLKTGGETFEIYVDPDQAMEYKKGTAAPLGDLLAVQEVFKDASASKKAAAENMLKVFGSADLAVVVDKIIHKGEIHLTAEQRKKMIDDKRKQIISLISRNSINPQTKAPNPPARIEAAMEEARVMVDPFKSAKEQVDVVVKEIRPILPIKFDTVAMAVKIPATYAGNTYRVLREYGEVKKEEWDRGDLMSLMEIPAGVQDEFYSKLNSLTHGEVKIKLMEK